MTRSRDLSNKTFRIVAPEPTRASHFPNCISRDPWSHTLLCWSRASDMDIMHDLVIIFFYIKNSAVEKLKHSSLPKVEWYTRIWNTWRMISIFGTNILQSTARILIYYSTFVLNMFHSNSLPWQCTRSLGEVGGWGRVPFSRNLMKPTPRRKWYLTTGRRFH